MRCIVEVELEVSGEIFTVEDIKEIVGNALELNETAFSTHVKQVDVFTLEDFEDE